MLSPTRPPPPHGIPLSLQVAAGLDPTKEVRTDSPEKALSPEVRRARMNLPQEIPDVVRREMFDAPEERAHQGHRALHRPLDGSPKRNIPVDFESVFEKYSHCDGGRIGGRGAARGGEGAARRGGRPRWSNTREGEEEDAQQGDDDQQAVMSHFDSPYSIREKPNTTTKTLDEVLNTEGDYLSQALKRANAAFEQQEYARRKRKEINERCFADITSCVGAILNRKLKKRQDPSLIDAKAREILFKMHISSDQDTSSSSSSGEDDDNRIKSPYDGESSDSSIDASDGALSEATTTGGGGDPLSKSQKRRRRRRRRGKRFRFETNLDAILDIVDSVNNYDDDGPRSRSKSLDESSIWDSTLVSELDDFFEDTITVPDEDKNANNNIPSDQDVSRSSSALDDADGAAGGNKLAAVGQTLRAAKKMKIAKKLYKERKEAEAAAAAHVSALETAGKPKVKTQAQKKLELERLAQMRKQLQEKREQREGMRKEAGKSNWFKKAIHVKNLDRTAVHPLRSGTLSPNALQKLQDVEFADESDGEQHDDDALSRSERELENTLSGALNKQTHTSGRPDSQLTIPAGDDGAEHHREKRSEDRFSENSSEDEQARWELAEQAAKAARAILVSDDGETMKVAPDVVMQGGKGGRHQRNSLLPPPPATDDDNNMMDDCFEYDEETGEWNIIALPNQQQQVPQSPTGDAASDNSKVPTKKQLLDMRKVDGCPNIFVVQEKTSRLESAVDVSVVNRSREVGAQWLLIDFSKCEGMDVRPSAQLAQVAPEKHLLCSSSGNRMPVAKMVKLEGSNVVDSALKRPIDVLAVSTEEALLLRSTLTRLASKMVRGAADKLRGAKGGATAKKGAAATTSSSSDKPALDVGADAIQRFLNQRTEEKKREEERAARRSMLQHGAKGGGDRQRNSGDGDGTTRTTDQLVHDKELKAVMDDAIASNPGVDANTLLTALERLRARQAWDRENRFDKSPTTDHRRSPASARGGDEDEIEDASKALLKSFKKIQKEKRDQKAAEKADRERQSRMKRDEDRERRATQRQLKELEDMRRKEEQDRQFALFGSDPVDKKKLAGFIERHASISAPGGSHKEKRDKKKQKELEEEERKRREKKDDAISALLNDPNNQLGDTNGDQQSPLGLTGTLRPNSGDEHSPFVRTFVSEEDRLEDERLRREYLEDHENNKRSGSGSRSSSGRGSRTSSNLLPAPSMSAAEYEAARLKQQQQQQQQPQADDDKNGSSDFDGDATATTLDGTTRADATTGKPPHGHDGPAAMMNQPEESTSGWWGGSTPDNKDKVGKPPTPNRPSGSPKRRPDSGATTASGGLDGSTSVVAANTLENNDNTNDNNDDAVLEQAALAFNDNKDKPSNIIISTTSTTAAGGASSTARDRLVGAGGSPKHSTAVKGPEVSAAAVLAGAIKIQNKNNEVDPLSLSALAGGSSSSPSRPSPNNRPLTEGEKKEVAEIQSGINNRVFGFDLTPRPSKDGGGGTDKSEAVLTADEYVAKTNKDRLAALQHLQPSSRTPELDRSLATTPTTGLASKDFVQYGDFSHSQHPPSHEAHGDDAAGLERSDTMVPSPERRKHSSADEIADDNDSNVSPVFEGSVTRGLYDTLFKPPTTHDHEIATDDHDGSCAAETSSVTPSLPPPAPPEFLQNPLLSDAILSSAFDRALLVAMKEGQTDRDKLLQILERDTRHRTNKDGSAADHHHHLGESMFRAMKKSEQATYKPPTRPPVITAQDIRRSFQNRVRDAILSSEVERPDSKQDGEEEEEGDDADTKKKKNKQDDEGVFSRPGTADAIRDLVKDHVDLTTALRVELNQLTRMLKGTHKPTDVAALRRAIIVTAWKFQHGREINLRKLILLLERKVHHRKWLPYVMNDDVCLGRGEGGAQSGSGAPSSRMYGAWNGAAKDRVFTGMMFQIMSFVSDSGGVHSIPTSSDMAHLEGLSLMPGSTSIKLAPRPPRNLIGGGAASARARRGSAVASGGDAAAANTATGTARRRRTLPEPTKFKGVLHLDKNASGVDGYNNKADPTLSVVSFAGPSVF